MSDCPVCFREGNCFYCKDFSKEESSPKKTFTREEAEKLPPCPSCGTVGSQPDGWGCDAPHCQG